MKYRDVFHHPALYCIWLLICSSPAFSQTQYLHQDTSKFIIGITSQSIDLEVNDAENPFITYGQLTSGSSTELLISYQTPSRYFDNSRWGYFVEFAYKHYLLSMQDSPYNPDIEPTDLSTSAEGRFYHLTPVLFYSWGDRFIVNKGSLSRFGIGLGMGYLQADGDIIFTETDGQTHGFSLDGFGNSIIVFFDYQRDNLYVRVNGGGPSLQRGIYDYEIFDFSFDIGYIIRF
ncbi:MAG: hypothetical protein HUJ30_05635 [Gammaproteobacteria bacterium]|nr:hypothetical protein [Gammaproteobacteria bacterium]